MKANRARSRAFTLVEILIVVVILGILAAIVVPQFTNAANDARGGNIQTQLQTLQNQIELFAARNNGNYPDLSADWDDLLDGNYLKSAPANPAWPTAATRTSVASGDEGTGSADAAWFFNTDNGTIYASYFDERRARSPAPRRTDPRVAHMTHRPRSRKGARADSTRETPLGWRDTESRDGLCQARIHAH